MEPPQPQRVELVITARTLLILLAVGALVALALLSLGTLISIFLAAVLAFGLDPIVGGLVKRGWRRGPASVAVFAALFLAVALLVLLAVGPVWREVVDFVKNLPAVLWPMASTLTIKEIIVPASRRHGGTGSLPRCSKPASPSRTFVM